MVASIQHMLEELSNGQCELYLLFYLIYFFNLFFPTVQQGDQVIRTCTHFSPTLCSVVTVFFRLLNKIV